LRQILSLVLAFGMLTNLGPALAAETVTSQINGLALGTNIEVHLTNKQKVRGARGAVSSSGFMLVDARTGERQIAFSDVASVKQVSGKSHTTRNILIGVGIGVVAVVATIGILVAKCGPFGC
jgi:hypothetical protein